MHPFMTAEQPHFCAPPNGTLDVTWWSENGIPRTTAGKLEECSMFAIGVDELPDTTRIIACGNGWIHNKTVFGETATTEWNLVCDQVWLKASMQSFVMGGALVGMIVIGKISDVFGRKVAFIVGALVLSCAGTGAAFASDYWTFNLLRALQSFGVAGLTGAMITLFMEIMPRKHRVLLTVGFGIAYAIPIALLAALSYFLRSFRYLQLSIGISGMVLIPFIFLLHESPKWLLAKRKLTEARRVIIQIVKTNRRPIPDMSEVMPMLAKRAETESGLSSQNLGFIDFLRVSVLRRNIAFLGALWFMTSTLSYYITLNAHRLPGNPHLNFALFTIGEFPAALLGAYALGKWPRRESQIATWCVFMALSIAGLNAPDSLGLWKVFLMIVVNSLLILNEYLRWTASNEIFPTPARGMSFAIGMAFSRLGGSVAPFVSDIAERTHSALPSVICVVFSVLNIVCVWRLPETFGVGLPDTIEEVEELTWKVNAVEVKRRKNANA